VDEIESSGDEILEMREEIESVGD